MELGLRRSRSISLEAGVFVPRIAFSTGRDVGFDRFDGSPSCGGWCQIQRIENLANVRVRVIREIAPDQVEVRGRHAAPLPEAADSCKYSVL